MKPLPEQMAFYAAYHRDRRNVATHIVGVPVIVFALMVLMALAPMAGTGLSLAVAATAMLLVYYLVLDLALGAATIVIVVPMLWLAERVAAIGTGTAVLVFVVLFAGGWALQLLGHKFEGNRPALTASLFQVFMAPLFLVAEVFFALGLKRALHAEVERRALARSVADPARAG